MPADLLALRSGRTRSCLSAMKWIAVLALVTPLAACVGVKPYERELLAQPGMSFDAPSNSNEQHMLESREGSFGGYGASGGGCGCN